MMVFHLSREGSKDKGVTLFQADGVQTSGDESSV